MCQLKPKKLYEKWEHFKRVCLKVKSFTMGKSINQSIQESNIASANYYPQVCW